MSCMICLTSYCPPSPPFWLVCLKSVNFPSMSEHAHDIFAYRAGHLPFLLDWRFPIIISLSPFNPTFPIPVPFFCLVEWLLFSCCTDYEADSLMSLILHFAWVSNPGLNRDNIVHRDGGAATVHIRRLTVGHNPIDMGSVGRRRQDISFLCWSYEWSWTLLLYNVVIYIYVVLYFCLRHIPRIYLRSPPPSSQSQPTLYTNTTQCT